MRGVFREHQLDFLLCAGAYDAFNMSGVPILSLPCGRLPNGEPAQVLLVADLGRDAELLATGKVLHGLLQPGFSNTSQR